MMIFAIRKLSILIFLLRTPALVLVGLVDDLDDLEQLLERELLLRVGNDDDRAVQYPLEGGGRGLVLRLLFVACAFRGPTERDFGSRWNAQNEAKVCILFVNAPREEEKFVSRIAVRKLVIKAVYDEPTLAFFSIKVRKQW